jgi:hypothetical protein
MSTVSLVVDDVDDEAGNRVPIHGLIAVSDISSNSSKTCVVLCLPVKNESSAFDVVS